MDSAVWEPHWPTGTERTDEPAKAVSCRLVWFRSHFEHTPTRSIHPIDAYELGLESPGNPAAPDNFSTNCLSAKLKNSLVISKYGSVAPKGSSHWPAGCRTVY